MTGWLALILFTIAFIATALYVEGRKQMKDVVVAHVVNDPSYPRKTPDGYVEHNGKITIGQGSWQVSGKFYTDPLVFYCQKDKADYSNGENCTLNPPYVQRSLRANRDTMIACYVLGGFFFVLFVQNRLRKTKNNMPVQQKA